MNRLLLTIILFTQVLLSALPSGAFSKVKVDPKTPEVQVDVDAKVDFWTVDNRLEQKVNIVAKRKTVLSILSDLSKQTGIQFIAGITAQDWQVRDRKMIIIAKDMQLSTLMKSIKNVMKFDWQRSITSDGKYIYTLFMDRNILLSAEAQAYREEERFNNERQEKRAYLADSLDDLANLSPDELVRLKEENPMMYAISASGMAEPLNTLFDGSPGMRDTFINGGEMNLNLSDSSENMKNAMVDIALSLIRMSPGIDKSLVEKLINNPSLLERISIQSPYNVNADNLDFLSGFKLGEIYMQYKRGEGLGSSEYGFEIWDYSSNFGKAMGEFLINAMESNSTRNNINPKELRQLNFGEKLAEHSKSFNIPIEIDFSIGDKIKVQQLKFEDILAIFADTTKFNVVSDSFTTNNQSIFTDKMPAMTFLNILEAYYSYNWWNKESTIELRDRHWFYKRSMEIPEGWLEKWRNAFKTTGTLDINNLAEMALLVGSDSQRKMNITNNDILNDASLQEILRINLSLLRFYSMLTPTQRNAIYQTGLDLSTLTSDQKSRAKEYQSFWNGQRLTVLTGTRVLKGKQFVYDFVVNDRTISKIYTPIYNPVESSLKQPK